MTEPLREPRPFSLRAWMELLRVPNLFTVPGDPLAGFLIASTRGPAANLLCVLPAVGAALCLYSAGLITNDRFDLEEDRRDRPRRPLPSGRVSTRAAVAVALILIALGVALAAVAGLLSCAVAATLAVMMVLYNAWAKRVPVLGPLVMGLCRGLSVMLGVAAAAQPNSMNLALSIIAASGITLYIFTVTFVASRETTGRAPGYVAMAPGIVMLLFLFFISSWAIRLQYVTGNPPLPAMIGYVLAFVTGTYVGTRGLGIRRKTAPADIAAGIGTFIRALIPAQAVLALDGAFPGYWVGSCLILLWPISVLVGRKFYSS